MLIKEHHHNNQERAAISWLSSFLSAIRRKKLVYWGLILLVFTAYSFFLIIIDNKIDLDGALKNVYSRMGPIPVNYLKSFTVSPDKQISINIKHKHFMKLSHKRDVALKKGALVTEDGDYVPATINYKGRKVKVKVRLKGDGTEHIIGERWSLRVKVEGESTLFGMKRFSLQHPKMRSYVSEWLIHRVFKREGLPALRYFFVDVTVNGKHHGLYAVEEHFEKRLIENNQLREGPILHYNEDVDIKRMADHPTPLRYRGSIYETYVDVYNSKRTFGDETIKKQFFVARNLMEMVRSEKMLACDAFDCDKLARYMALIDLLNGRHVAKFGDLKIYYNPMTSKLEPLVFDAEGVGRSWAHTKLWPSFKFWDAKYVIGSPPLYSYHLIAQNWFEKLERETEPFFILLKDERLFIRYLDELGRISSKDYLDRLFEEIDEQFQWNMKLIHKEWPFYQLTTDYFYKRQARIQKVLAPPVGALSYLHEVYPVGEGASRRQVVTVNVANLLTYPIRISSLELNGQAFLPVLDSEIIVDPSYKQRPSNVEKIVFARPLKADDPLLDLSKEGALPSGHVTFKTWAKGPPIKAKVMAWKRFGNRRGINALGNVTDDGMLPDYLVLDEKEKTLTFKPGDWTVTKTIKVPQGLRLIAGPGVRLKLKPEVMILSYSPVEIIGSKDSPVEIYSDNSQGQGIAVFSARATSRLENVTFRNLTSPSYSGWALTGAVTFYESDIAVSNVRFLDIASEDAINIVRSKYSIALTEFKNVRSDAIDTDFAQGKIFKSRFNNIGNDAIDVSGSEAEIEFVQIEGAGDKGISIGERSRVNAKSIIISKAKIGIATKDTSEMMARNISIENSEVGFAAYQKKPEFGPSQAVINSSQMNNVGSPFHNWNNSSISYNGSPVDPISVIDSLHL